MTTTKTWKSPMSVVAVAAEAVAVSVCVQENAPPYLPAPVWCSINGFHRTGMIPIQPHRKRRRYVDKGWSESQYSCSHLSIENCAQLARKCNITVNQVNHWFINARVRRWRPTMEKAASKALSSGSSKALAALVKDCGEHNPFAKFLGELKVESGSRKQPT